jgi:broad specificity phosphatase PhoE
MKLTIIRNGQTIENAAHIFQGHSPGKLDELGKQQAADVALQLAGAQFDAIYCSDLQRCLDTAAPVRAQFSDVPFYTDIRLRERSCGDWTGKTADDMTHEWHALPGDDLSRRMPGGGESWNDVTTRVAPFLNELLAQYPNQSILLVTHGGPLRSIRSLLEHRPLAEITIGGTANGGIWNAEMTEPVNG